MTISDARVDHPVLKQLTSLQWLVTRVLRTYRRNRRECKPILYTKVNYEGHLESNERFAIKKYLLIIGKKKIMQVLSHTFT